MNTIEIHDKHRVRIITINRPKKRNALTLEMYSRLTEYLIQGDDDNNINAFMIKGQDNCFTSGNDITDFLKSINLDAEQPAVKFLFTLIALKKPIIAAVSGDAVGIGTTLLLHCDLVYADDSGRFQLPFIDLSLVPEAGASLLLPRLMGHQKASELLLLGESFDANTAYSLNLVNRILDRETLVDYALEQAFKLAQKPPQALQATRALLKPDLKALQAQMHQELKQFAILLQTDTAKARFKAFLDASSRST